MKPLNFDDIYAEYVKSQKQKVWAHDRSQWTGGSEIFGCIRKAWYGKHGTPKDESYDDTWGAMERGNLIEDHFVAPGIIWWLKEHGEGAKIHYAGQKNQRTFMDKASRLAVTPDGLITGVADDALANYGVPSLGGSGCFNFEIKSIDPRVNLKEEKAVHRGQVQIQMGMTREQTRYKPNHAVILYMDASFLDDIEVFVVGFEPHVYAAAKKRSMLVWDTTDPSKLEPEGKIDQACKYCPFKGACAVTTGDAMPTHERGKNDTDLPLELQEEFTAIISAERALSAEKKAVERDHAEAAERLKAWLREVGEKKVNVGDVTVTYYFQKGRKTLDVEAMRDDGVDVDKYFKIGNGFDVLRISEKGAKNDAE